MRDDPERFRQITKYCFILAPSGAGAVVIHAEEGRDCRLCSACSGPPTRRTTSRSSPWRGACSPYSATPTTGPTGTTPAAAPVTGWSAGQAHRAQLPRDNQCRTKLRLSGLARFSRLCRRRLGRRSAAETIDIGRRKRKPLIGGPKTITNSTDNARRRAPVISAEVTRRVCRKPMRREICDPRFLSMDSWKLISSDMTLYQSFALM